MIEKRLITRKELIQWYPALGAKKYRLDWLIRTRQIPMVRLGRRVVFFDPSDIDKWIQQHKIRPVDGGMQE